MPTSLLSVERSFPGDRSAPRAAADWFRKEAREAGLPSERLDQAELCLDEVLTNVIRHGGNGARPAALTVSLRSDAAELLVIVEDDGRAFDPRLAPAPVFAPTLDQAMAGGWGVFLIRSIADDLRYERRDGCNRVTLVFRLGG